jgi:hypothetical protein
MERAIPWLIAFLLIGLMFWALLREQARMKRRTTQEYEQDLARARSSMLRAGMLELDRFVGNESGKRAAVEYLKDEEGGMTKTGGNDDEKDRTRGE